MKKSKTSILLAAFLIGGGMLYLQASYPAKEVVQYGVVEEIADNLYEPPEQMEEEAISDTQAELNANDSSPTSEVSNPEEPSQSLGDDTKGTWESELNSEQKSDPKYNEGKNEGEAPLPDQETDKTETVPAEELLPMQVLFEPTYDIKAFSADLSRWRSVGASESKCFIVGVDVPTTIEVNRGEGNNETFPIGTGDGVLLLTPVCHTYAIAATYTPQIEGKGMIYLDYGNEAITAFSGQNYGTLTYLNLAENNLNRTEVITELFTALPALRELNVADNAFTVTEYNDFLLHFNGLNLGFTGIIDTTAVQYGGCSETFSGEAVAAHEALIAAGRELRDGGKAVCPVAPIPVANGGGGGGHLEKDVCPEGDNTSSYYDGECGKESEHNVANEDKTSNEEGGSLESMYYAAYRWANGNGITTADTYEAVRISDVITRAEMAKMISMLATKLWYKVPDVEKRECVQFADMKQVNEELQSYVIESCQLGLMGMHGDGIGVLETFSPTKTVTRAEVGTILSRLLRGREYATQPGDETYYARHLQALKDAGIMKTVTYPEMLELRGNILLMLWRSLGK